METIAGEDGLRKVISLLKELIARVDERLGRGACSME